MSQPLSITVDGWDDFIVGVDLANNSVQDLLNAGLQNSVTEIQSNVRQRAPHKTGNLQRSVLTSVNYPTAQVIVDEVYGTYVENGTAPHDIFPKNKKALYWNGAFSPVKAVHHPGTRAQPFFAPGVDASLAYVDDQLTKIADKLISFMAG